MLRLLCTYCWGIFTLVATEDCRRLYFLGLLQSIQQSESISFMRDSPRNANLCNLPSFSTSHSRLLFIFIFSRSTQGSFLRRKLLQSNTELAALLRLWYFTSRTSFWPCPAKLLLTSAHNKTSRAKVRGEKFHKAGSAICVRSPRRGLWRRKEGNKRVALL